MKNWCWRFGGIKCKEGEKEGSRTLTDSASVFMYAVLECFFGDEEKQYRSFILVKKDEF